MKESLEKIKKLNILYVEDQEDTREEVEYFLKKRVSNLYIAKNGKEGLEEFKKYDIDLVISDVQMPIMDGLEMIQEIKQLDKSTNFILTTAFNDNTYLEKAKSLDINSYIFKPINLKSLIEEIIKNTNS